jgi:hypothetical protein
VEQCQTRGLTLDAMVSKLKANYGVSKRKQTVIWPFQTLGKVEQPRRVMILFATNPFIIR